MILMRAITLCSRVRVGAQMANVARAPLKIQQTLSDFLTNISVLHAFYSLTFSSKFTPDYKTKVGTNAGENCVLII
jgi:hypothetical protein